MASLRAHEGDTQAAATLLEEAERLYTGDFSPDVRPVAATRARLAVRTGDLVAAHVWQRRSGLTVDDPLTYLHEYEHVTVVRVLLAEHLSSGDPAPLLAATALLRRLAEAAESSARVGTLIEVNVLQAIASEAAGRRDDAVSFVDSALTLAEPEGWVRPLADESTRLRQALPPLRRPRAGEQPAPEASTARRRRWWTRSAGASCRSSGCWGPTSTVRPSPAS